MVQSHSNVAIVVSGVIGPSIAAVWALIHQRTGHRHERELADLAELRAVIDDGLAALSTMDVAAAVHGVERSDDAGQAFITAWSDALGHEHRLRARLGSDHTLSHLFHFAVASLGGASGAIVDNVDDAFDREWNAFRRARDEFAREAATLVASKLPSTESRPRGPNVAQTSLAESAEGSHDDA